MIWEFRHSQLSLLWHWGQFRVCSPGNWSRAAFPKIASFIGCQPNIIFKYCWNIIFDHLPNIIWKYCQNITCKYWQICYLNTGQISFTWYADINSGKYFFSFQNTSYSNIFFGRRLVIQIWIFGAFYVPLPGISYSKLLKYHIWIFAKCAKSCQILYANTGQIS